MNLKSYAQVMGLYEECKDALQQLPGLVSVIFKFASMVDENGPLEKGEGVNFVTGDGSVAICNEDGKRLMVSIMCANNIWMMKHTLRADPDEMEKELQKLLDAMAKDYRNIVDEAGLNMN